VRTFASVFDPSYTQSFQNLNNNLR